jgi:hypothetical protein
LLATTTSSQRTESIIQAATLCLLHENLWLSKT